MNDDIVADKIDGVLSTLVSIPEPQRTQSQIELVMWRGMGRNLVINVLRLAILGAFSNVFNECDECLNGSVDIIAGLIRQISAENDISSAELLLRIGKEC